MPAQHTALVLCAAPTAAAHTADVNRKFVSRIYTIVVKSIVPSRAVFLFFKLDPKTQ